jgi:uncharacterized membrane protein
MTAQPAASPDRTARGLGWTSVALGLPPLLAPRAFSRAIGLSGKGDDVPVSRAVGVQELLMGAGLLAGKATRPLLWSRVAGDALHLGMLRQAMSGRGGSARTRAAAAGVAGIAVVDLLAAVRHARTGSASAAPMELTAVTTVNRPPEQVYDFWRGLERLPRFMHHLESVEWVDEGRTRWTARGPARARVSWDAELVDDERGRRLSWRSLPGADVPNEGSVDLTPAPGGKGTEVRVHLRYDVPGGKAGRGFSRLFGEEPHQSVEDDLRRFKQVVETGDVVRSDGSPEGTSASRQLFQRPGQPVG